MKLSVLFVCHANICRSPTAEAVLRHKAKQNGCEIHIDSAGTHASQGRSPDKRSQKVSIQKGYDFSGIASRSIEAEDFSKFDYIVPMDTNNLDNLLAKGCGSEKLKLMMSYADENIRSKVIDVPDPYRGGMNGFDLVLTLIEYACDGLIREIQQIQ